MDTRREGNLPADPLAQEIQYGNTAQRPPYPKAGDIYIDTEADTLYACFTDNTWSNVGADSVTDLLANGNWKAFYSDGSGDGKELALGADATFFRSAGAAAAPTFSAIAEADLPSTVKAPTRTVILPAAGGAPTTTAGCADNAKVEMTTNDVDFFVLDFDTTTAESAFWSLPMPDNWDGGTMTAKFYWTAASGSGGVVWGIKGRSFADDEALDQAYGTEVETADTLIAANDMHVSAESTAITLGGTPAGAEGIQFKITRKTAHASDTLGVDARFLYAKLQYTTNAASD